MDKEYDMHKRIPIESITITDRVRKELGDIESLSNNIRELGLLSPIVVNQNAQLLAGERRLAACKLLGWTEIDAVIKDTADVEQEKLIEISENEFRKNFTMEEVVNVGLELERIEKIKAEEARLSNLKQNSTEVENLPPRESGKTRDIVAKKLGMSGKQYEHCKFIVEHKDLVSEEAYSAWNNREDSTHKIYSAIKELLKNVKPKTFNADKKSKPVVKIKEVPPADYEEIKAEKLRLENELSSLRDQVANADDAEIERMKAVIAEKDEKIESLSNATTSQREKFEKARADRLQSEKEELQTKISQLESELDNSIVDDEETQNLIADYETKIKEFEAEISRLKKTQYSPQGQELNAVYDFSQAASEFITKYIAPIRYNDVVQKYRDEEAGKTILKTCIMLSDAVNDVIKRFNVEEDIIDAEV